MSTSAAAGDVPDYIAACKLVAGDGVVGTKLTTVNAMPVVYLDQMQPGWAEPSSFVCEFDASSTLRLTKVWTEPPCDCIMAVLDEAGLAGANDRLRRNAAE